jgi:hypothetical protein
MMRILWLFSKVGGALYNGMGGVSVENIQGLMRTFGIPSVDRAWLMERVLIFMAAYQKAEGGNGG